MDVINKSSSNNDNLRTNVRYTLSQNMMKEYFSKWIVQQVSNGFIQKLVDDCKKTSISMVNLYINKEIIT